MPDNLSEIDVSVIIPCFNASAHVSRAIESVLSQSFISYEVIVVDDCSSDGTPAIVNSITIMNPKVRLISLSQNSGTPARPRNVGVSNARGQWVAFLDADDIWHPNKLELQMELIRSTGVLMCSTGMNDFKENRELDFLQLDDISRESIEINFQSQLIKYMTPTSSIFLRRDIAILHPFPEERRYRGREDYLCMLKIHEHIGTSLKLISPLVYYRHHDIQISRNKLEMTKKQLLILREYRCSDGTSLGLRAYYYIVGHIILSIYYRLIRSRL